MAWQVSVLIIFSLWFLMLNDDSLATSVFSAKETAFLYEDS